MKNMQLFEALGAAALGAVVFLALGAAGGNRALYYTAPSLAANNPATAEEIVYKTADAPETKSADGVITADEWASVYPDIAVSMGANSENSYHVSYLEEDPYLVNIYEGYGFAKDYESARGHSYTLEDVAATARPHAAANCLTCKTPNFTKLVNDQGVDVYSMDFNEVYDKMVETVSCYNCHDNNAGNKGELTVTHSYVNKALGENVSTIKPAMLVCGQCHIEYYFAPGTKETTMPYSGLEEMTPEAILAYYDAMDYADWTQESTGAKMLKAQHPELETVTHGKHASFLSCADCHMPLERAVDGSVYHSHTLVSPLENEQLLASCASCHGDTDMVSFVKGIQKEITDRETEVGDKLSAFKDKLAEANQSGSKTEAELEKIRGIYRSAQWYFDFCYVENSEGAHNSQLSRDCLNRSEELIEEGMAYFA